MKSTEAGIQSVKVYFSDFFNVDPKVIERYGAFNISLINDLPLFIDPFLIFNSKKTEYQRLHKEIIDYVSFLRDKAATGEIDKGLLSAWFYFPEVKQNWLGFSATGNAGRGLGSDFGQSLQKNLHTIFSDFGNEQVAKGSHLEKLCLIREGVGRDNISDFATNLIKHYLLGYTQTFAKEHIDPSLVRRVAVKKSFFNYETQTWESAEYELPYLGDYVILTPRDILTRDQIWINKNDLYNDWERIVEAVPNAQIRAQISNYFLSKLPRKVKDDEKEPKKEELEKAITEALTKFPLVIDTYIGLKEKEGHRAEALSIDRVEQTERVFVEQLSVLISQLSSYTDFYKSKGDTLEEARVRVEYLKTMIEDGDGYRFFYAKNGEPNRRETDIHIMFKLVWCGSPSDVNAEVNNGRGPVDFAVSRGAFDKTLVEFKLASNPQLKKNLKNQLAVYSKANRTEKGLKVILYFSEADYERVNSILDELDLKDDENVVLIDARKDNKKSGSKA